MRQVPIRGTFFTGTRGVVRVVGVACVDEDCVWAFVLQASVRCGSGKENERCRRHLRNVQDCRMCRNNMHIADAPLAGFPSGIIR